MNNSRLNVNCLILGANGFLGTYLSEEFKNAITHSGHSTDKKYDFQCEINSQKDVRSILNNFNLKTIINTIALADIEECEKRPELAHWLNSELPKIIAQECKSRDIKLLHYSTDAVFDGNIPYRTESEEALPKSVYGKTKLMGELNISNMMSNALILRVNFFGKSKKQSIFNFFYNAGESNSVAVGYQNLYFTPLYVRELTAISKLMLENDASGLYHAVGSERLSKYEFGKIVYEVFNFDLANLHGTTIDKVQDFDINLRNIDLSLSNAKLRKLGISTKPIRKSITSLFKEIKKNDKK